MERYFLNLSYDGSSYNGWQKQPKGISIQHTLEVILSRIFHQTITVYGCGRTDAGVHAENYVAHINLNQPIDQEYFRKIINLNLPNSIALNQIFKVHNDQHARYDAILRKYTYYLTNKKIPQKAAYSGYYSNLTFDNISRVEEAIAIILTKTDFRAFCNSPDKHNHTLCILSRFTVSQPDPYTLEFEVHGNRFLKQMIRILIGSLIEILRGNIRAKSIEDSFAAGEIVFNKQIAKAEGLHFTGVNYDYYDSCEKQSIF
jgi:tRNA pseudouridine38-40 synthase